MIATYQSTRLTLMDDESIEAAAILDALAASIRYAVDPPDCDPHPTLRLHTATDLAILRAAIKLAKKEMQPDIERARAEMR